MQKDIYGKRSEIIAVNFLKNNGYKILKKNYKNTIGEIDIIALDKNCIVFIEVKARLSQKFGNPFEAIDNKKIIKIRNVATLFLKKYNLLDKQCRFDAISIIGEDDFDIKHIKNAF